MLSAAPVSAQHAAHYYSTDNYCSAEEAKHGSHWQGKAATRLELSGTVDADAFASLLQGHTLDGQSLQQRISINHVAGIDLTFSAPKSISLASLWGGDTNLFTLHQRAVQVALNAVEAYSGTRLWQGNEFHRQRFRLTNNLAIAQFDHTTSRAQDPQLHTHNIVLNTTYTGQDWRALDSRRLFKYRKLWQSIYHQELRLGCQQLGYPLTILDGHLELAGYAPEHLAYWSKRRQQILKTVSAGASVAQKQIACLRTRSKKLPERSLTDLRQQWEAESQTLGIEISHPRPGVAQTISPDQQLEAARRTLEQLTRHLGQTQTVPRLALLESAFSCDGWGNPSQQFGYADLQQAVTEAVDARHLYEHNGQLSRSAQVFKSKAAYRPKTVTSRYLVTDAIGLFAHDISQGKQALLLAPVEAHHQLTLAIRRRLWQTGVLSRQQTAQQQTASGIISVTLCCGDRLRVPGRAGPVPVQVEATHQAGWVQLRHRNGKTTLWDLSQPKSFKFDWVHSPNKLPSRSIQSAYSVTNLDSRDIVRLQSKTQQPITIYQQQLEQPIIALPRSQSPIVIVPSPDLDQGIDR